MRIESESELVNSTAMPSSLQLALGERWFVVMTQPGKEHFAARNLANQDLRSFAPRLSVTHRHARRVSTRLAPLFPQYLFVILNPAKQRWRAVNGTLGVRSLIGNEGGPIPVGDGVVETLLESCNADGVLIFRSPSFKPGDRVRLVAGPFAGVFGHLQSLDASGRVRLLLEIMRGRIMASADITAIIAEPQNG